MELPAFLLHSSSIYVVLIDRGAKIISVNPLFKNKFSSPGNSLEGIDISTLIVPADVSLFKEKIKTCTPQKSSHIKLTMKDIELKGIQMSWECALTKSDAVAINEIICIGHEVYKTNADAEILANGVINSLPGIFYLQDETGKYLRWNKNFETVSGYSAEEIASLNPLSFFDKKDHDAVSHAIARVFTEGSAEVEAEVITKKKQVIPYFFNGSLINYDGKKCLIGSGVDITGKIKDQRALAESEKKYYVLFEQASDPIMVTDFKGNFIDVNTVMCNLFGYTKKELLSMHISGLIDSSDLGAAPIRFDLLAQGDHIFSNRRMVHKDGTIIYVEANVKKINNDLVMAIARDVTEVHKIQRQIEVSEATFRGAFENSPIGMALVSPEGNWLRVNKQLCQITGYSQEELLGKNFTDITHPDDLADDTYYLQQCISGKLDTYRAEKRYYHKNGSLVWIKLNTSLVRDGKNNPLYFIAQVEDITGRMNETAEKERIRSILNERVKELTTLYRFGKLLQGDELSIKDLLKELVAVLPGGWQFPEIAAARIVFANTEFRTSNFIASPYKQQVSFKTPDGTNIMIEVVYLEKRPAATEGPFVAEERNLINMLAEMFRIYLTRKEESEALKKSEANLHSIFDATDSIYVLLDKKFRIISYNKPAAAFAKREMNLTIKVNNPVTKFVPAQRRSLLIKNMKKALAGEAVGYEVAYTQKDGTKKWYDTRILNIAGGQGQVFGLVIAVLDITENKLLEIKILEQKVQEQKKISRAIIKAQEKERNYLGQELHDNVSQILAGTKLYMKAAGEEHTEVKKLIRYPIQLIDSCIHELRQLSSRQVTPLKNIRLKKLVETLLLNWKKNATIKTRFIYNTGRQILDDDLKLNIYRIIQEQLNNITKYAKAKNVTISILADKNSINVRIVDDGIGFNTDKKRKGIGISNMINRITAFNGEFYMESSPGKGCKIQVTAPLNANNK